MVSAMVRLSNHFLEDLEQLANIYKWKGQHNWQEIDPKEFATQYNTVQMITNDISVEKRKRAVRKGL